MNRFDGYRVYNGCPDSTMQARLDTESNALKELRLLQPEAHITYFPLEDKWMVHIWGHPLSGMRPDKLSALADATHKINNSI